MLKFFATLALMIKRFT